MWNESKLSNIDISYYFILFILSAIIKLFPFMHLMLFQKWVTHQLRESFYNVYVYQIMMLFHLNFLQFCYLYRNKVEKQKYHTAFFNLLYNINIWTIFLDDLPIIIHCTRVQHFKINFLGYFMVTCVLIFVYGNHFVLQRQCLVRDCKKL